MSIDGITNHVHAFNTIVMFTVMDQYNDGTPANLKEIYQLPTIYSDNGFESVGAAFSQGGITITPAKSGNAISFNVTTSGSAYSDYSTKFTQTWSLSVKTTGVAAGAVTEAGQWISEERTIDIVVMLLPFWRDKMLDFVNLTYGQSFDGQSINPDVPWSPYVYNGTFGGIGLKEMKMINGGMNPDGRYTGLYIETDDHTPNARYMHGTASFRGAFQIIESAGDERNGRPTWYTQDHVFGTTVYRCLGAPLSAYQIAVIPQLSSITQGNKDDIRLRGMNLILIEDNHNAEWTKSVDGSGVVTWSTDYTEGTDNYTGKIKVDHGTVTLTGTRQGLLDDEPIVVTTGPYTIDPLYDIPPKATWSGFDFDRGAAIWYNNNRYVGQSIIHKYEEHGTDSGGNPTYRSEEYQVPEPTHWHDIYAHGLNLLDNPLTGMPDAVNAWITELQNAAQAKDPPEVFDMSSIIYDVYDNGTALVANPDTESLIPQVVRWSTTRIIHITAPKSWFFVGDTLIEPTTTFSDVALVYSPGGYVDHDVVDLIPVGKYLPGWTEPIEAVETVSLGNQYAKLNDKCVVLPGVVASMLNVPPCAHNFMRNLKAVTISYKITHTGSTNRNTNTSQGESYGEYEGSFKSTSLYVGNEVSNSFSGTCTAIGIIDSANPDYIKLIFAGTAVSITEEYLSRIWGGTVSRSLSDMLGEPMDSSSGNVCYYPAAAPSSIFTDPYVFGEMVITTARDGRDNRPTEVIYFPSFYASVHEQRDWYADEHCECVWYNSDDYSDTSWTPQSWGGTNARRSASYQRLQGERWVGEFTKMTAASGGIEVRYTGRGVYDYEWDSAGDPTNGYHWAIFMRPAFSEMHVTGDYDGNKVTNLKWSKEVGSSAVLGYDLYGDIKSIVQQMKEIIISQGATDNFFIWHDLDDLSDTTVIDNATAGGKMWTKDPEYMLSDDFIGNFEPGTTIEHIDSNIPYLNIDHTGYKLISKKVEWQLWRVVIGNFTTLELTIR